jgi:hypothetical protein
MINLHLEWMDTDLQSGLGNGISCAVKIGFNSVKVTSYKWRIIHALYIRVLYIPSIQMVRTGYISPSTNISELTYQVIKSYDCKYIFQI